MRYLIGIGTYTARDDSIGLRIAETIAAEGLDRDFRAIDLGGNLLDLLHYLDEEAESVLVADSARMGLAPGGFAFFEPEQVSSTKALAGFSTHEDDLLKVLELARSLGQPLPPITILGIEPADVSPEVGLSPALERRFGEYIDAVLGFFDAQA
jgi:hydrogenase maturation protease